MTSAAPTGQAKGSFPQAKHLNMSEVSEKILAKWRAEDTFQASLEQRRGPGQKEFVFYEGPPSANGMPGIHHVLSRTLKDLFLRYKAMKGFHVSRKAGWDTHGLPIEIAVEKKLGIRKEDIGSKISVEDYNNECKKAVMEFRGAWETMTERMGYWVNLDEAYVTYDAPYMETLWWLLKQLHEKGLLYKGYTVQPYSPMAGTGLSSHELNQPGCYRDVKDLTVVAQFQLSKDSNARLAEVLEPVDGASFDTASPPVHILAWTTTPWTLPAHIALCVGPEIDYVVVKTYQRYTKQPVHVLLAEARLSAYFKSPLSEANVASWDDIAADKRHQHYETLGRVKGQGLQGLTYQPVFDLAEVEGRAFEVLADDYVTTEDGTGVVHMAPAHGADDQRVCMAHDMASLLVVDANGRYRKDLKRFAGLAVKDAYETQDTLDDPAYKPLDVRLVIDLKERGLAFHSEKYEHSYAHCWRTDKPIIYYPLDSWFIKTTAVKDRLVALNETIRWQPPSTGTGRFGKWLENLVDWNLSRSRFWGTPLPIWSTEDGSQRKVIGSVAELKREIAKAQAAGLMQDSFLADFDPENPTSEQYEAIDLHRTTVDKVVLVSDDGLPMRREDDIIDVWFESGAMPYAQLHYPFENKDVFEKNFPADYIAEGMDQTRGWFFTLHALGVLLKDSVAFKSVISTGLVLDKNGQKMSKRLGNVINPTELMDKHGVDPVRWYILANSTPWDNTKFDEEGVKEVKRKFFDTLSNTYAFFVLYANIDGFDASLDQVPVDRLSVLDRWILSELQTMLRDVESALEAYEPTKAARLIQDFTIDMLSNWYVRLSRKRFWKGQLLSEGGDVNEDKAAAFQTLSLCLLRISQVMAPMAPFYADELFGCLRTGLLNGRSKEQLADHPFGALRAESVHLSDFPGADLESIQPELEKQMHAAQTLSSIVLSLRDRSGLKVRQPLAKVRIPVRNKAEKERFEAIETLLLAETNLKAVEYLEADSSDLVRTIKANFKALGPKLGKQMKAAAQAIGQLDQQAIQQLEADGEITIALPAAQGGESTSFLLSSDDVDIRFEDIPGWLIESQKGYTLALDTTLTEELKLEGLARELVNRIQNARRSQGFKVTDRIRVCLSKQETLNQVLSAHGDWICQETLADDLQCAEAAELSGGQNEALVRGAESVKSVKSAEVAQSAQPIELAEGVSAQLRVELA